MTKINSIEGLKIIKQKANCLPVRIKRDKWKAVFVSDMTAIEFIDVLIMWIEQNREVNQ